MTKKCKNITTWTYHMTGWPDHQTLRVGKSIFLKKISYEICDLEDTFIKNYNTLTWKEKINFT